MAVLSGILSFPHTGRTRRRGTGLTSRPRVAGTLRRTVRSSFPHRATARWGPQCCPPVFLEIFLSTLYGPPPTAAHVIRNDFPIPFCSPQRTNSRTGRTPGRPANRITIPPSQKGCGSAAYSNSGPPREAAPTTYGVAFQYFGGPPWAAARTAYEDRFFVSRKAGRTVSGPYGLRESFSLLRLSFHPPFIQNAEQEAFPVRHFCAK